MKKTKYKKNNKKKNISFFERFRLKKIDYIFLMVLFSGVLLISATYAWFYASLNVRIDSLTMGVSDESGLFISLDGINFGSTITVSKDELFNRINSVYKEHTSQWPSEGLYPVSTNGIKNPQQNKFEIYDSTITYADKSTTKNRVLTTRLMDETKPNSKSSIIAFDIFLKNITGSPYEDNVYLDTGSGIVLITEEWGKQDGIINSVRMGFLKMNTISKKSNVEEIQSIDCSNKCKSSIYEPYAHTHAMGSINRAMNFNVQLRDGEYFPTYAVINTGSRLTPASGQEGSGLALDTEHFAKQETVSDPANPLFGLSTGITKVRVYVWIEGQDIDSLETRSKGAKIKVTINFYKDLEGYNH